MKTISREELERMDYVQVQEERKGVEVWAYYNKRLKWNPKTQEIVEEWNAEDSGRYQTTIK